MYAMHMHASKNPSLKYNSDAVVFVCKRINPHWSFIFKVMAVAMVTMLCLWFNCIARQLFSEFICMYSIVCFVYVLLKISVIAVNLNVSVRMKFQIYDNDTERVREREGRGEKERVGESLSLLFI